MRALVLSLLAGPALALPPVTQDEATRFHEAGLCAIAAPGKGITRADGDGWIVSSLPGPHRLYAEGGQVSKPHIDFTPGKPVKINVSPVDAVLQWCPAFKPAGRDDCGPVPRGFLYDAVKR